MIGRVAGAARLVQPTIGGVTRGVLRRMLATAGLGLAVGACGLLRPQAAPGEVIFQDDFSRPNSGWDRYGDPDYSADYYEGAYRIHVLNPDVAFAWANPDLEISDARIEVDAIKIGGPDNNVFGVLCRFQDFRNYYFFLISSDGFAGIGLNKDGQRRLLSDDSLLPSEAVLQGEVWNHIRADCDGFTLRLFVNGQLIAETRVAEWSSGDIGLIVGTYEQAGTEVLFDNFSVVRPEGG